MRTFFIVIFSYVSCISIAGKAQSKNSTYLSGQYSRTLYDYTIGNNLASYGLGLQTFFHNKTPFKPTIELSGDFIYLDDKLLLTDANGSPIPTVTSLITVFGGAAFHPVKFFYVSFLAGPAYVNDRILPGLKPSIGFYFDKNQKFTSKISYINIFNRYKPTGDDYGLLSFALGFKL